MVGSNQAEEKDKRKHGEEENDVHQEKEHRNKEMSKQKTTKKPAANKTAGKNKTIKSQRQTAANPTKKSGTENSKPKPKKDKLEPKNEFRYNFNKRHKQYVFGETETKYKSLGITHEAETFGKKNMPLKDNPQKGKTEKAYIRNGIVSDKKRYYSEPIKNNEFSKDDMGNVKAKVRNYKKRQKTQKK